MTDSALIETDFTYLPLDQALAPHRSTSLVAVLRDRYWAIHPERGLLFYVGRGRRGGCSPQCNNSQEIVKRLCPDFAEVRFLPLALVPVSISGEFDYRVPRKPSEAPETIEP